MEAHAVTGQDTVSKDKVTRWTPSAQNKKIKFKKFFILLHNRYIFCIKIIFFILKVIQFKIGEYNVKDIIIFY